MATLEQAIRKHRTILAEYNPFNMEDELEAEWYWDDFIDEVKTMMKKISYLFRKKNVSACLDS